MEGSAWQKAEKVACEHSFFHWDLEFPDVFYDRDGKSRENPGFDAVIGNPPYVRQELIKEKSALQLPKNNNLCQPNFVIPSKADRSVYFYYHSLNVIRNEGKLGFITSDSWMSAMYGKSLQEFLLQTCNIVIIMKTKFNVFSADTKTVTLVLNKKSFVSDFHHVKISYMNSKEELVDMKSIIKEKLQNEFVKSNWNDYFVDDELQPKINMIEMSVAGKIKRGKVTGYKDFFVMSSQNADKHHIAEKYRCPVLSSSNTSGQLNSKDAFEYILNVNDAKDVLSKTLKGRHVLKYIESGENTDVVIKRGSNQTIQKLYKLPTMKSRKIWYSLNLGCPPAVLLGRILGEKLRLYENNGRFHAINTFVYFTPKNKSHTHAFLAYFASAFFSLCLERNGRPMGGGALSVEIIDWKKSIVPCFDKISKGDVKELSSAWKGYCKDMDQDKLDASVLTIMKFDSNQQRQIKDQLHMLRNRRLKISIQKKSQSKDHPSQN